MAERRPRIYLPQRLSTGERYTLTGDRHHHLSRVLRLKAGAEVTLFDGMGGEYAATIEEVRRAASRVRTGDYRDVDNESPLHVRLAQGIGRGERTDYAIQKAVGSISCSSRSMTRRCWRRSTARSRAIGTGCASIGS